MIRRHLRVLAFVLAMGSVVLLMGCAGSIDDSTSQGQTSKTYSNTEYGFRLDYPATYEQVASKASPALSQYEFSTTFADPGNTDEAQAHDESVDVIVVAVTRLPRAATRFEARGLLKQTEVAFRSFSGDMPDAGYFAIEVLGGRMTTLSGAPCLVAEMTYANAKGARQHDKLYMVVKGDVLCGVQLTAAEDRWQESRAVLQTAADSFQIL